MGHHDDGGAFAVQLGQQLHHFLAVGGVEIAGGFVGQDQLGPGHHGAGDGDALLLANLIAWPLAWYYLNRWLEGFADRIVLSPLYFIAAGLIALAIAWATVFTHALRVARDNPINALRTE